jgi:hypothetical protein
MLSISLVKHKIDSVSQNQQIRPQKSAWFWCLESHFLQFANKMAVGPITNGGIFIVTPVSTANG